MNDDETDLEEFADINLEDLEFDAGSNPDSFTLPDNATLTLVRQERGWQMFYTPNPEHTAPSIWGTPSRYSSAPILLAEASQDEQAFVTYPINTSFGHSDYLGPKYDQIRSISLERPFGSPPDHIGKIVNYIRNLPAGFVKGAEFGLGLHRQLNYIVSAVEKVDGVTDLRIGDRPDDAPYIVGNSYRMTHSELQDARKALARAHDKALRIAADEKRVYLHNTLLHRVDARLFPEKARAYRKDALREAIGDSIAAKPRLSAADEDVLIRTVKASAVALVESKPAEVMELSREIEVVTLRALIVKIEKLLAKNRSEGDWQSFFIENPFVLRLAFGIPIAIIGGSVSVGGRKFDGSGEKIADFAAKAMATGNLALIEIKRPDASLIEKGAYRGEVHSPTRELAGAVNQVLDQRYRLQAEINNLKANSRMYELESYAMRGLVIAGTTPNEPAQQKSFELYRNSLHSVSVVTYDELLLKLKQLLEFLEPEDTSPSTDAPVEEDSDIEGSI